MQKNTSVRAFRCVGVADILSLIQQQSPRPGFPSSSDSRAVRRFLPTKSQWLIKSSRPDCNLPIQKSGRWILNPAKPRRKPALPLIAGKVCANAPCAVLTSIQRIPSLRSTAIASSKQLVSYNLTVPKKTLPARPVITADIIGISVMGPVIRAHEYSLIGQHRGRHRKKAVTDSDRRCPNRTG